MLTWCFKVFRTRLSHLKRTKPFSTHINPAALLRHSLLIDGLPFPTEKPVNENLGRIGMRCFVDQAQGATGGAGCGALFNILNGLYRSSRIYKSYQPPQAWP